MPADVSEWGELPAAFLAPGSPSFLDFLAEHAPEVLPGRRPLPDPGEASRIPHGTTIVAATYAEGVLIAGDRRITQGHLIAHRDADKVFRADEFSAVGISGAVGPAVEMVRLFQLELEHYEKVEGTRLSLPGKVNRLSTMIRGNLGVALRGLAVVPILAGYDLAAGKGRIFSFDITGGFHEEYEFDGTGSGSPFARASLKKLYRPGMSEEEIVTAAVQSLYDAAEEDTATGGPDLTRRVFPLVALITEEGYRELTEDEISRTARAVVGQRTRRPDGPVAPVG